MNEKKVLGHSLSNSGVHSMSGLFFSKLVTDVFQANSRCCENVPFPSSLCIRLPSLCSHSLIALALTVGSCMVPAAVRPSGVSSEEFRAPRSLQSISSSYIRLLIFQPALLPAQTISNQKCNFSETRIIMSESW